MALARGVLGAASSLTMQINPLSRKPGLGVASQLSVMSPPSVSAVQGPAPAATLINFDNPTVQKALDNLIQSGPNLLRNISVSQAAVGAWPGQGITVSAGSAAATSAQQAGLFPSAITAPPGSHRPPY